MHLDELIVDFGLQMGDLLTFAFQLQHRLHVLRLDLVQHGLMMLLHRVEHIFVRQQWLLIALLQHDTGVDTSEDCVRPKRTGTPTVQTSASSLTESSLTHNICPLEMR